MSAADPTPTPFGAPASSPTSDTRTCRRGRRAFAPGGSGCPTGPATAPTARSSRRRPRRRHARAALLAGGRRPATQATSRPDGTADGTISPDGRWLWWFDDDKGDERGVWRRQPFGSGPAAARGRHRAARPPTPSGLALGHTVAVVGSSDDAYGVRVHAVRRPADGAGRRPGCCTSTPRRRTSATSPGTSSWSCWRTASTATPATRRCACSGWMTTGRRSATCGTARARGCTPAASPRWPGTPGCWSCTSGAACPRCWSGTRSPAPRATSRVDAPGEVTDADWWPDARSVLVVARPRGAHDARAGSTWRPGRRPRSAPLGHGHVVHGPRRRRRSGRRGRRRPQPLNRAGAPLGRRRRGRGPAARPRPRRTGLGRRGGRLGRRARRAGARAAAAPGRRRRPAAAGRRRARRPHVARRGRVRRLCQRLGRPRLRGGPGQLPRLDRLRVGLARRAGGARRATSSSRTSAPSATTWSPPASPTRPGSCWPGAPGAASSPCWASAPSPTLGASAWPASRSPTTWPPTRTRWRALKAFDRSLFGGSPAEVPEQVRGLEPDHLRRAGPGAGAGAGRRERPALPDPADRELRGPRWPSSACRTRCTGTTPDTGRWSTTSASSTCAWSWTSRHAPGDDAGPGLTMGAPVGAPIPARSQRVRRTERCTPRRPPVAAHSPSSAATSSASCRALSAAPLRRLSPHTNISSPQGSSSGLAQPPHEGRVGADHVGRRGQLAGARVVEHHHARVPRRAPGAPHRRRRGRSNVACTASEYAVTTGTRTQVTATGSCGSARTLRVSSRTVRSSTGPAVTGVGPDPRHHVERQRSRERAVRAELVLHRPSHVTRLLAQPPLGGDDLELVVEPLDAALTGPGGRLVGRDDQPGEAPAGVQRTERVDHGQRRAGRARDDAQGAVTGRHGVDLGHHERDVGVHPEHGRAVDNDGAALCGDRSPLLGDVVRDVEHGDVHTLEDLRRQGHHLDLLATDRQQGAGRTRRGREPHLTPEVLPGAEHPQQHRADQSGSPHHGEGRLGARHLPVPP